jgi:hypothetical protein
VEKFADRSISVDQLEAKVGLPTGRWTAVDLAQLTVIYGSLVRGEVQADDEFPPRRVTAQEIAASVPPAEPKPAAIPAHTDHDPAAVDSDCPGCAYDSAEADRKAAEG